jgi:hypothetical protein
MTFSYTDPLTKETVHYRLSDEAPLDEVFPAFRRFLLGAGYVLPDEVSFALSQLESSLQSKAARAATINSLP